MSPDTPEPSEESASSHAAAAEELERLRRECPVKTEHKSIFPGPPWRWQPAAASWVWAVLKEAGGRAQGSELTERLAQVRGEPHRKANGLRNRGLFVLEAFGLVEIERSTGSARGGPKAAYGAVTIVRERIDEGPERDHDERASSSFVGFVLEHFGPAIEGALATPVGPEETVCLELTEEQRTLLADPAIFFLDSDLDDEVEREREARDGLHLTLEQLDRFGGYIAAHANHAEDAQAEEVLHAIFEQVRLLELTHEPRGEDSSPKD